MIRRYRGLREFTWEPSVGVNCLIGPADTGKSTVLAAISFLLAPYPVGPCSEFDYYQRRVHDAFEIEACISAPDLRILAGERLTPPLRGWLNGQVVPLPDEGGADPILVVRARGTADMEALHEILPAAGDAVSFSVGLRKRLALARLSGEDRAPRDLRAGAGSLVDRFLSGADMRAPLHRAVADASRNIQLPGDVREGMARMAALFDRAGLPSDLHLGIVPMTGTSLPGMVALLQGRDPAEAIPIAMSGTGTKQLALLELSSALAGEEPVIIIDEPERGLEPYRQRVAARRIVELTGPRGHAFATTHSPAVLGCMPASGVWRLRQDAAPVRIAEGALQGLLKSDPEAFLSPMPIFCEGATEVGLLEVLLPARLGSPLDALGLHMVDGNGQPDVLAKVSAFADAGLRCGAFLDNEAQHPERRARLEQRCTLFVWEDLCNVEEAVAGHLPIARLPTVIDWAASAQRIEARHLAVQVRDNLAGARSHDIGELVVEFGEAAVRRALCEAMVRRRWFKSVDGGRLLAQRLIEYGIPDAIDRQIADFATRLALALQ